MNVLAHVGFVCVCAELFAFLKVCQLRTALTVGKFERCLSMTYRSDIRVDLNSVFEWLGPSDMYLAAMFF